MSILLGNMYLLSPCRQYRHMYLLLYLLLIGIPTYRQNKSSFKVLGAHFHKNKILRFAVYVFIVDVSEQNGVKCEQNDLRTKLYAYLQTLFVGMA